jgi:ubiquinone/menaquinone biosynthesis C-methylase UbiE
LFRDTQRRIKNLLGFWSSSLAEANRNSYNSPFRVAAYAGVVDLKKPERTILNLLKAKPRFKRMLDIGVGGGRTTKYFAEIADEYVGIDYSENMIKMCRKKFQKWPNVSFAVANASDLSAYDDNNFDFVLDSGALDSVNHEDRIQILHEIRRVTREEGYFCFSSSNLDAMLHFCRVKPSKNPKILAKTLANLLLIRLLNPEMWLYVRGKQRNLKHTMFIVGDDDWGLRTYCISAEAQVNQLKELGFENIRIYDLQGNEMSHLTNTTDRWLWYLCNVNKREFDKS